MAFKITDECIACGACVDACPCDCIYLGDNKYEIKADDCISCSTCASVCPVSAPVSEDA
jgi:formate hydrogenlyase subunit 6/NADH:ubiquinone oxidoreductase subunit I